jgi:hypothetical protein
MAPLLSLCANSDFSSGHGFSRATSDAISVTASAAAEGERLSLGDG